MSEFETRLTALAKTGMANAGGTTSQANHGTSADMFGTIGDHVAKVLRAAEESARVILSDAETAAAARMQETEQSAEQAEQDSRALREEAAAHLAAAHEEAQALLLQAQQDADELRKQAMTEASRLHEAARQIQAQLSAAHVTVSESVEILPNLIAQVQSSGEPGTAEQASTEHQPSVSEMHSAEASA